jgi:hypothetical protein
VKKRRKPSRRKAKAGPISLLDIKPPAKRPKSTPEQEAELAEMVRDIYQTMAEGAGLAGPRKPKIVRVWSGPEATEPAANPLSAADWLFDKVAQRKEAGDIPKSMTVFAKQIELEMAADMQARKCLEALAWESIRRRLYGKKLRELLGLR